MTALIYLFPLLFSISVFAAEIGNTEQEPPLNDAVQDTVGITLVISQEGITESLFDAAQPLRADAFVYKPDITEIDPYIGAQAALLVFNDRMEWRQSVPMQESDGGYTAYYQPSDTGTIYLMVHITTAAFDIHSDTVQAVFETAYDEAENAQIDGSVNEVAQSGETENESAQSGEAENESAQSGGTENESAQSGETENESAQSGETENESAQSGEAENETAQSGEAENESARDDESEEAGSAQSGTAQNENQNTDGGRNDQASEDENAADSGSGEHISGILSDAGSWVVLLIAAVVLFIAVFCVRSLIKYMRNTANGINSGMLEVRAMTAEGLYTPTERYNLDIYDEPVSLYDFLAEGLGSGGVQVLLTPVDLDGLYLVSGGRSGLILINKGECEISDDSIIMSRKKIIWRENQRLVFANRDAEDLSKLEIMYISLRQLDI